MGHERVGFRLSGDDRWISNTGATLALRDTRGAARWLPLHNDLSTYSVFPPVRLLPDVMLADGRVAINKLRIVKTESGGRVNGGMSVRAAFRSLYFTLAVVISGCGSDSASESQIASGEGALGRGTAAYEQKDYVTAEKELSSAVRAGASRNAGLSWIAPRSIACICHLPKPS